MKTLELKHLAAYLPYKLNCNLYDNGELINNGELMTIKTKYSENSENPLTFNCKSKKYPEKYTHPLCFNYVEIKPILRPLSDISKIIEHDGKRFSAFNVLAKRASEYIPEKDLNKKAVAELLGNYSQVEKLIEWHFDVFGLIEAGLSLDFNKV